MIVCTGARFISLPETFLHKIRKNVQNCMSYNIICVGGSIICIVSWILVRHARCGWWVVVTHIDEWGGEDMETGPSTSPLCDVLVFLKWVSLLCTHYITYPMIFLTWIGRIIQCLPWIVYWLSPVVQSVSLCCAVWRWVVQEAAGVWVTMLQWLPCCSQANKLGYHNHYWPSLAQGPCMYHSELEIDIWHSSFEGI